MSMMSHRVRLMPYSSKFFPSSFPNVIIIFVISFSPEPIRVSAVARKGSTHGNLLYRTPPYNADFDGDEMNMQYV
jgi:DNA-directed RNA polymerase beta' subunit